MVSIAFFTTGTHPADDVLAFPLFMLFGEEKERQGGNLRSSHVEQASIPPGCRIRQVSDRKTSQDLFMQQK